MGKLEGEKERRDDNPRDLADRDPDKKLAPKKVADTDDKLGTLADCQSAKSDPGSISISSSLEVVKHGFHWFNDAAQRRIDVLRTDLKKEDEPDWFAQLAQALLEVGLGAGAAAAGVRLAEKFAPAAGEVGKEFVKMLFEGGIGAGVTAGRAKLAAGKDDNVVDPFIDSHKKGVEAAQIENQTRFIKVEQHQIKTVEGAEKLAAACSEDNVNAAADKQYEATRDAWVSYLAQSKFGAIGRHGPVQKDSVNVGPTRTNMSSEDQRARTNQGAPGFVPSDAPNLSDAVRGDAPGVLEVLAKLPAIDGDRMADKPTIEVALLNGVNGTIRKQYEGVPLGEMRIPRQVVAKVDGAPDFTLSLDETGSHNYLDTKQRTWLAARAVVGHPENASKDDWARSNEGIRLLLQELVPSSIKKSIMRYP